MNSNSSHIKLTPKEEKYSQEYVKTGNKSEAYRLSYSTKNMTSKTVNEKACRLFQRGKVRARIKQLQEQLAERNKMTLDKVVQGIAEIATFDIAELYDEKGNFKNIHDIPRHVRTAITGIKVTEEFEGFGEDRTSIGFTKDIKIINKLDAYKDLMKHFGGYKVDNAQKADRVPSREERDAFLKEIKEEIKSSK